MNVWPTLAIYYSIYDFYTLQIPVGKDQSTSDTDNVTVIEHTIDTVCCTLIFKTEANISQSLPPPPPLYLFHDC